MDGSRSLPISDFPGNTIIIDHGLGVYSYLAHLSKFTVEEGAMVERGQRIALSGATGRVTGPHLHWTMRMESIARTANQS